MRKAIYALILIPLILSACVRSKPIDLPEATPTLATDTPEQIASVEQAIRQTINTERESVIAFIVAKTSIENIEISSDGEWAIGWLIPIDPDTNEPVPIEPGLVLLRYVLDEWQVWLPTTQGWSEILPQIPDEILSPTHRAFWEKRSTLQAVAMPTALSGYKLPWEAGITRRLTQGPCHDEYIPSGNAHYSFDFSTYGELWDIHAAKGGQMWLWKDDVPTCHQYTCNDTQPVGNYVVIKDNFTDPDTYHLYLHLAQDSIPDEIKIKGLLIQQGQFIGIVDNTGQSWGHHLHFQVQVPLYGEDYYWGRSVDITFDDVDINGGRPRVQNAWCNDLTYCDRPDDVCDDFRENYTSGNAIPDDGFSDIYFPLIFNQVTPAAP